MAKDVDDVGALGSGYLPAAWRSDNESTNHYTMELSVFVRASRAKASALEGTTHSLGGGMDAFNDEAGSFGCRMTSFGPGGLAWGIEPHWMGYQAGGNLNALFVLEIKSKHFHYLVLVKFLSENYKIKSSL